MKKITFIFLITLIFLNTCFAKDLKPIVISVNLSEEALKRIKLGKEIEGKPIIRYCETFSLQSAPETLTEIPITIKDSKFIITIKPTSKFGCIQFRGFGLGPINAMLVGYFHVEAGDNFCFNIKNNGNDSFFSGQDAPKMNYQKYVGEIRNSGFKRIKDYKNPGFEFIKKQITENLKLAVDSLDKIENMISTNMYQLLRLETPSCIYYSSLTSMTSYLDSDRNDVDSINKILRRNELASLTYQQFSFPPTDNFLIKNAFTYNQYTYQLSTFFSKYLQEKGTSAGFESLYNLIKARYSGLLRDQLIVKSFLTYIKMQGIIKFLPEAIKIVKDKESLEALMKFSNAILTGVKGYNFVFEDENGKKKTLTDFKGKLVVIDTWFNGCFGCVELAKRMHPIMTLYKNNKNIVFLSINVDRDKQRFTDGINSGLYGNNQSQYLYTAGRGTKDPWLLHYQYTSYPNLLIIDKNGNVLSYSPPTPFDEVRKKALIDLINQNL